MPASCLSFVGKLTVYPNKAISGSGVSDRFSILLVIVWTSDQYWCNLGQDHDRCAKLAWGLPHFRHWSGREGSILCCVAGVMYNRLKNLKCNNLCLSFNEIVWVMVQQACHCSTVISWPKSASHFSRILSSEHGMSAVHALYSLATRCSPPSDCITVVRGSKDFGSMGKLGRTDRTVFLRRFNKNWSMNEAVASLVSSVMEKACPSGNKSPMVDRSYLIRVRCTSVSPVTGSQRELGSGNADEYSDGSYISRESFSQAQLVVETVCMSKGSLGSPFGSTVVSWLGRTKSDSGHT